MKKYSGFTLIEMLIVMGIIIVLMAAGIAGGRFALQRANRIQKISSVDNIEQALWGYYSDNRRFPYIASNEAIPPVVLLRDYLADYIDAGQFDGGSDGTFYYFSGAAGQEFVVCGTLGGFDDEMEQGIYCNGNGISSGQVEKFPGAVATDGIFRTGTGDANIEQIWSNIRGAASNSSRWYSESRGWIAGI